MSSALLTAINVIQSVGLLKSPVFGPSSGLPGLVGDTLLGGFGGLGWLGWVGSFGAPGGLGVSGCVYVFTNDSDDTS